MVGKYDRSHKNNIICIINNNAVNNIIIFTNNNNQQPTDENSKGQVLDLSANQIEGVPPRLAAALPALVELVLDENNLRALGNELSGLPRLKKLSARSNRVAAVDPFSGEQVGGRMAIYLCCLSYDGSRSACAVRPEVCFVRGSSVFAMCT